MPFRFLEEEATADIAFEAWGKGIEETFLSAGDAVMNVMVEDLDSIRPGERRTFKLKNEALDLFLLGFLQELIYYKDSESLMLRPESVCIQKQESQFVLEATARGEKLDPTPHRPGVDVKAVTLHRFSLEKNPQGWKAFVILDI